MEKQEIINFINTQVSEGKITKSDLMQIAAAEDGVLEKKNTNSKNIINVFYAIGAIIALVGIIILVAQNWEQIGFGGRMFVTLGVAVATYAIAFILKNEEHSSLSQVLFTVSAVLAPMGTGVWLNEAKVEITPVLVGELSLLWAIIFGAALWFTRRNILIIVTAFFATVSLYSFAVEFFKEYYNASDLFKWLTIIVGITYLTIAKELSDSNKERKSVQRIFYALGTIGVLGSLITFSGIFNFITLLVIFGAFYASVFLRSSVILFISAIFLVAHIIKITSEYFADSINWAFALILVGFLIIGIGYSTFYLNKKYISKK